MYLSYYEASERYDEKKTIKQHESSIRQRKVKNRPCAEELYEMIKNEPFTTIGKKYGVDGNTIKKWCKYYGIPHRKEI